MLIRYPGGKSRLFNLIIPYFPCKWRDNTTYCEPFFGAGGMGFKVMEQLDPTTHVIINDMDPGLISLWTAVLKDPNKLCTLIQEFTPSVQFFNEYKKLDSVSKEITTINGFRKLALHQMSFSGLGAKAGSAIGGASQSGKYLVDCRYNKITLCKNVNKLHKLMSKFAKFTILNDTAINAINAINSIKSTIYLDPPYYVEGSSLYTHSMLPIDHQNLGNILKNSKSDWVLSYDNCEQIKTIYSWAKINNINTKYTLAPSKVKRTLVNEIIITKI